MKSKDGTCTYSEVSSNDLRHDMICAIYWGSDYSE